MLFSLIALAWMLRLADRTLRNERLRTIQLAAKFKLFAIRDRLRIEANPTANTELFEYLDTTLTRATVMMDRISLWHALTLIAAYAHDELVQKAISSRRRELEKPANAFYAEIYQQYITCLGEFLLARHCVLVGCLTRAADAISAVNKLVKWADRNREIVSAFGSSPGTSTLLNHFPRPQHSRS